MEDGYGISNRTGSTMEPVKTVVTVLAMAAAMKLKHTTEKNFKFAYHHIKVKHAYRRIKALIQLRYPKVDLGPLEKDPESEDIRVLLEKELVDAGAGQDQELLKMAIALQKDLEKLDSQRKKSLIPKSRKSKRDSKLKIGNIGGDLTVGGDIVAGDKVKISAAPRAPIQIDTALSEPIQFTSYYPAEIKPTLWYTLLAYVHIKAAQNAVHKDSQIHLGQQSKDYRKGHGKATKTIARGTKILIIPQVPGCRFNPQRASVLWLEDWHRIEFRMQASEGLAGFELNTPINGRISFYVGPILVAEIKMMVYFSDDVDSINAECPENAYTEEPYQAVFVSYSHSDTSIVQGLEKAYFALGIKYLRDVHVLRSGEKWNQALLKKIEEADIFQLCWSESAKQSPYVEREWRHALKLQRQSFIRPVYWETPMPDPPKELADIHFAYLDIMA